jgi:hypothetical protein
MKRFLLLLPVLACGPAEEPVNLGTLEQPIYMPAEYGREGDGSACSAPWSGSICKVPDWGDHEFKIKVDTGACDAWTRDRIQEAVGLFQVWMGWYGWDVNRVTSGQNGTIRCDMGNGDPGTTAANAPFDYHGVPYGTLLQYGGFTVTIRPWPIYTCNSGNAWTYATLEEKVNVSVNVIMHELFHVAGLGHNGEAGELMSAAFVCSNAAPQWQRILEPTDAEASMLLCYNPNSGPNPWCG